MSKRSLLIAAAALTLTAAAQTFASDAPPATGPGTTQSHGANFVDKDGDGICDNYGTASQGRGKAQKRNRAKECQGSGCGKNFVDADKDGVCDHLGERRSKQRKGRSRNLNR